MKRSIFLAAAVLPLIGAAAYANTLTGEALRQLVTGKTVYLSAPLGGEFPLRYRADGTVTGDGDAVGLGRFYAAKETGKWFMSGNNLCQQFPTWYSGQRLCFSVQKLDGARIRWTRDNGETGIARVANR